MKKVRHILSILVIPLILLVWGFAPRPEYPPKKKLEGLWKIVTYTDMYGIEHDWMREKYKFISKTRFAWMDFEPEKKKFYGSGGGRYLYDGKTYREVLEYYYADNRVVGDTLVFSCTLKGDKWYHEGVFHTPDGDIHIKEVWEKAE